MHLRRFIRLLCLLALIGGLGGCILEDFDSSEGGGEEQAPPVEAQLAAAEAWATGISPSDAMWEEGLVFGAAVELDRGGGATLHLPGALYNASWVMDNETLVLRDGERTAGSAQAAASFDRVEMEVRTDAEQKVTAISGQLPPAGGITLELKSTSDSGLSLPAGKYQSAKEYRFENPATGVPFDAYYGVELRSDQTGSAGVVRGGLAVGERFEFKVLTLTLSGEDIWLAVPEAGQIPADEDYLLVGGKIVDGALIYPRYDSGAVPFQEGVTLPFEGQDWHR